MSVIAPVSPEVPGLVAAFPEAGDFAALARLWVEALRLRLAMRDGLQPRLVAVFGPGAEGAALVAASPAQAAGSDLLAAVEDSRRTAGVVVRGTLPGARAVAAQGLTALALPIRLGEQAAGWIGLEAGVHDLALLKDTIAELQLASGWLADRLRADRGQDRQRTAALLHCIIAVVEGADFAQAAHAAVTELALRFGCDRVALGLVKGRRAQVKAISHAAEFQPGLRDPRDLAAAMDESIDQEVPLLWPPDPTSDSFVLRAHQEMARHQDDRVTILTVPMVARDEAVGAVVFQRPLEAPFETAELAILEAVVTVLAPILIDKHLNDRWLAQKAVDAARLQAVRLFGPRHVRRKLVAAALVAGLGVLLFGQATRTVVAEAVVEAGGQRVISASAEGFIAEVKVREGDGVRAGDVLIRLDDRDLVLERLRLVTLKQQEELALDGAIAARDRSQTAIRQARIRQYAAQIALTDARIDRMTLRAPFDGLVLSGDLDRLVGSAVTKGAPLLTLAPAQDYRVMLTVDETDVARTELGQGARLRLTALPDRSLDLVLVSTVPVAVYDRGRTSFRLQARLEGADPDLRHGMQGVARIETGRASLWSIWVAPLFQRLTLALWSWRLL